VKNGRFHGDYKSTGAVVKSFLFLRLFVSFCGLDKKPSTTFIVDGFGELLGLA
jgi:hypothetical protein